MSNANKSLFLPSHLRNKETSLLIFIICDTQTNILPTSLEHRKCVLRSKIRWFTDICNSHDISRFAVFFIDLRVKVSVVKSCIFYNYNYIWRGETKKFPLFMIFWYFFWVWNILILTSIQIHLVFQAGKKDFQHKKRVTKKPKYTHSNEYFVNDPTAGSPTVTLLRLLLPLNDKVWMNLDKTTEWLLHQNPRSS